MGSTRPNYNHFNVYLRVHAPAVCYNFFFMQHRSNLAVCQNESSININPFCASVGWYTKQKGYRCKQSSDESSNRFSWPISGCGGNASTVSLPAVWVQGLRFTYFVSQLQPSNKTSILLNVSVLSKCHVFIFRHLVWPFVLCIRKYI